MTETLKGLKLNITGIVQGVGFRPFVYSLAVNNQLKGWVLNSSSGVEIEVNGLQTDLDAFVRQIREQTPPLARIDRMTVEEIEPNSFAEFTILSSQPRPGDFVPISPDVSICDDCTRELFDPANRRYRYPFINCTNCGPRFTIIQDIPYDRPLTTMADFQMCPDCEAEYRNPLDRRFHAQPTACPVCGPQVKFISGKGGDLAAEGALQEARQWLRNGKILAIKGLGGYHLACDAFNGDAVDELRRRKRRSDKPFALMAFDMATIHKHCHVSPREEELLLSHQHPVVILARRAGSAISPLTAPHQNTLGMMLPYTPLHLLLMEPEPGFPEVLVMTSGNLSEEPIAYEDEQAAQHLGEMADAFLIHNRPIHMRTDDSVARIALGNVYMIRRARGYAPDAIMLSSKVRPMLAAGSELKNTFTLARDNYAFMSHHIGDLENFETLQSFESGIRHYERLFKVVPEIIACDMHPNYLATRYAVQRAESENLPLIQVQHHHAHLASCLADNGWQPGDRQAIGIILDGTGMGTDGTIWGGEVLIGNYAGYTRRFHLEQMPLPGGDAAIRHPVRTCLAYLWKFGIEPAKELAPVSTMRASDLSILTQQLVNNINTIPTSSMGRLFDAVSSLIGVCQHASYEGQAAIDLENAIDPQENGFYAFPLVKDIVCLKPLFSEIIQELQMGVQKEKIAARFHNGIIRVLLAACQLIRSETGITDIALSGGVWQNMYLLTHAVQTLSGAGFNVMVHHQVPTNDGGISLGQLAVCEAQL
ncbi:MAG: carbamoyltransferase HypF [Chloroflexi bacterium]|nr:carbamoyltransferase HypF [Chloroflexota bacterium]